MSIYPSDPFQSSGREYSQHVSLVQLSVDLAELLPASGSAWVMSEFMRQMYSATRLPDKTWPQTTGSESLVRLSQWQVLTACIIYGCSVASFLHRRRLRDSNVPPIFTVCVALGVLVGKCTGAGIDYIMLVHASWATCLAMIACVACPHIQLRLSKQS